MMRKLICTAALFMGALVVIIAITEGIWHFKAFEEAVWIIFSLGAAIFIWEVCGELGAILLRRFGGHHLRVVDIDDRSVTASWWKASLSSSAPRLRRHKA